MKTVVLQSFRTRDVPAWMARALASVASWSEKQGYDYDFRGDEIFALCGDDYLAAVGDNKCSITNLARLEWIRMSLASGYERAIWLDADTFIFDPERFSLDVRNSYACGKEVWIGGHRFSPLVFHGVHNAALVFARHHPDLDAMIGLIRHIAATRTISESLQVGVKLLTGLHAGLKFPLLTNVGMLSPVLIDALARRRRRLPRLFARENGHPIRAANVGFSLGGNVRSIEQAMDVLEESRGEAINRYLGNAPDDRLLVAGPGVSRPRLDLVRALVESLRSPFRARLAGRKKSTVG
ncbi:MAG: hypothetical protein QOG13_1396 [Sphingomonadales bacterium]|jgi:hypothetical protein|nr:hypothetical protein [Sphingomonadales bacterium]